MEQTTLDNVLTTSDGGVQQEVTIIPTWHVVLCLIIERLESLEIL